MRNWLLILIVWLVSLTTHASPLPAAEVFQVESKRIDPNTFVINWQVKPGYFLYSDKIKITEQANSNTQVGRISFPKPSNKTDSQGRVYTVYRDQLSLPVAVLGTQPGESLIDIHFQGCADDGFCYPPETKQIRLTVDKGLALAEVNLEITAIKIEEQKDHSEQANNSEATESKQIEAIFKDNHWLVIMLSFLGLGLLLSFTPCVLPMVPVLSGIIVGHGKDLSTRKAFLLSLSYVLSMSLTYALVGALVAGLGSNLQIAMQSPTIIVIFSLIFVVLALSMFGYYELRLPLAWQTKLGSLSRSQSGGHYLGAALMGCLSTLILSPCVTAPLIGVLGYIASSGNIAFGSLALFFLGLGMGLPLLLIGTSAGKLLPKAGLWMNRVKAFFGVMLLAVAIYLLERVLPGPLVMGLWACLLIFSGIFCGAFIRGVTNQDKFSQGLGLILLVYGLLILVGASMGSNNPLQPLSPAQASEAKNNTNSKTMTTVSSLNEALSRAKGKPILLDFYADWCASCKILEATTLKDRRIVELLKNFVVLKADVTNNNEESKALLSQFNVIAPPTFLFLNQDGDEQLDLRLVGEFSANELFKKLSTLNKLLN